MIVTRIQAGCILLDVLPDVHVPGDMYMSIKSYSLAVMRENKKIVGF